MKSMFLLRMAFATSILGVTLAGCAAAGGGTPSPSAAAHDNRGGMRDGSMMDMQAMCEMHAKEMAGRTQQERQAMMEEHMKSMSPEMRQRMQAMMAQCP